MNIKIVLEEGGIMPTKEHPCDAAYDLYIPESVYITQHRRQVVPLNFRIELPEGYGAFIMARSGVAAKGIKGYKPNDTEESRFQKCSVELGLVDCGYRGVVGVILDNSCGKGFWIKKGTSFAQMVIMKVENINFVHTNELVDSERGEQGFNS